MLVALLALACRPPDPGQAPHVVPIPHGPEPTFVELRPGERASFTWTLEWPGDTVPEGQFVVGSIDGQQDDGSTYSTNWVVTGRVMEVAYTAPRDLGLESFGTVLSIRQEADEVWSVAVPLVEAEVDVRGGPVDRIVTWDDQVALAVGEIRPFQPCPLAVRAQTFPAPGDPRGEWPWSEEPVRYATSDPTVASVDDDGVLRGIAAGTTSLVLRAGDVERQVSVTVTDAAMGPPPLGSHPIADTVPAGERNRTDQADGLRRARVAFGPDGSIATVVRLEPGLVQGATDLFVSLRPPLVLARWTGTGWGYELLGTPTEQLVHAGVAIDALGDTWVVTRSLRSNALEVWWRPAGTAVGGWTRRALPVGLGPLDGPGDPGTWSKAEQTDRYWPISITDRPGGGLWVAWATTDDFEVGPTRRCPRVVRAASVGPETLAVEIVERTWLVDGTTSRNSCEELMEREGGEPQDVGLGIGAAVGSWPAVLFEDRVLTRSGAGWTASDDASGLLATTWDLPPGAGWDIGPAVDDDPATGNPIVLGRPPLGWTTTGSQTASLDEVGFEAGDDAGTWIALRRERVEPGGDEVTGARMLRPDGFYQQHDQIHVLDDGTRFLRSQGELWRFAPDAPPAQEASPVAVNADVRTWVDGDRLGMVGMAYGPTIRWWDGGFTDGGVLAGTERVVDVAEAPGSGGLLLVQGPDFENRIVRLEHDGSQTSVPLPTGFGVYPPYDGLAGLFDGGVAVVHGVQLTARRTARYDAAGALVAEGTVLGDLGADRMVAAPTGATFAPPGFAVFDQPDTQRLWTSADGVTWTSIAPPPGRWSGRVLLDLTTDGELVWAGIRDHGFLGHQVALVTSTDAGISWSEPAWVREGGSARQQLVSLDLDGSEALLVIYDHGDTALVPGSTYATDTEPRGELWIRASLP
ncbi:MAG: hypothetical protein H6736_20550 [Alphaproteobacteria bacterium]|nr:hypothetical protein [Alphaproteobacteria bacterium]MCB9694208.1 hypothetical protein [Alphaproteobacteria bacterium]